MASETSQVRRNHVEDGGVGCSSDEASNDRGAKDRQINLAEEGNHDCTQH